MNPLSFIRWREWGPDKITFFFTFFFYAALAAPLPGGRFLPEFLCGTVFISSLAVFGYLANDLGDRETDRAGKKKNSLNGLQPGAIFLVFAGVLAVMAASSIPFLGRGWFAPLWAAQVIGAAAYSLPPLRLKGRGVPGLAANVAAQFALPVLLIFAALGRWGGIAVFALAGAAAVHGAAAEIGHQLFHLAADRAAGVETLAVRLGEISARRLYRAALLLDRLAIGGIAAVLAAGIPPAVLPGVGRFPPALPLVPLYLWLLFRAGGLDDPFYFRGRRPPANLLHALFPQLVVPFYLSLLLAAARPVNIVLPLFFLLWILPGVTGEKIGRIAAAARIGNRTRPPG